MTLTLPIALDNGNDGRSKHWGAAASRRKSYERLVRLAVQPEDRVTIETPVKLTLTRVLGKGQRLYDADSLGRGNAKEIIDALVAAGFLPDDGPRHVIACEYRQDASQRQHGPATIVQIEAVA